jgi:hypothetical protein
MSFSSNFKAAKQLFIQFQSKKRAFHPISNQQMSFLSNFKAAKQLFSQTAFHSISLPEEC